MSASSRELTSLCGRGGLLSKRILPDSLPLLSYCLKFPPSMVGAVEGKYPERKAAGFGHDPETALVRTIMVEKA